jgi:hypothetical protein
MLFINEEKISVDDIREYRGKDTLMKELMAGLKTVEQYLEAGHITFKYKPGLIKVNAKSGMKEGKGGIYVQFVTSIPTDSGAKMVVYAEHVEKVNNNNKYKPRGEWVRKRITFNRTEIEKALFYLVCSAPVRLSKSLIVEDMESEAAKKIEGYTKYSALRYYIFGEDSPLATNRVKLAELGSIFGVAKADELKLNMLKNSLYEAVLASESRNMGEKEFLRNIEEATLLMKCMGAVQRAVDRGVIEYKDYQWQIKGSNGKPLCRVHPSENENPRKKLATMMITDLELRDTVISYGVEPEKEDVIAPVRPYQIPPAKESNKAKEDKPVVLTPVRDDADGKNELTDEILVNGKRLLAYVKDADLHGVDEVLRRMDDLTLLEYHVMRAMCLKYGINTFKKNRAELVEILTEKKKRI